MYNAFIISEPEFTVCVCVWGEFIHEVNFGCLPYLNHLASLSILMFLCNFTNYPISTG